MWGKKTEKLWNLGPLQRRYIEDWDNENASISNKKNITKFVCCPRQKSNNNCLWLVLLLSPSSSLLLLYVWSFSKLQTLFEILDEEIRIFRKIAWVREKLKTNERMRGTIKSFFLTSYQSPKELGFQPQKDSFLYTNLNKPSITLASSVMGTNIWSSDWELDRKNMCFMYTQIYPNLSCHWAKH